MTETIRELAKMMGGAGPWRRTETRRSSWMNAGSQGGRRGLREEGD